MSDRIRKSFEMVAAVIGVAAGLAGMFGAFVLLPSRMEAAERQITRLNERDERNRELLVRLEERQIQVLAEIKKIRGDQ